MASIEFEHVVKIYPGQKKPVVPDMNLKIKDKEFIILVGPSGCGKSTTLRMIAGLEDISKGTLRIDGKRVNDVPARERDIAMVFQSYALYPNMTVYKNIAFPLKVRKLTQKEIDSRVKYYTDLCKHDNKSEEETKEILEKVKKQKHYSKEEIDAKVHNVAKILDLEPYLDRKPANLSGGQRQRVALGRAMVRSPKVFLLDEPLSNLDAKLRTEMRSQISLLHKKLDTTFVYVTHDQTEAMTIADRIVVLDKGVVQQFDTPRNLYERPVNKFVAGFIGSPEMNFLEGTLSKQGDKTFITIEGQSFDVSSTLNKEGALNNLIGQKVTYGIRPEAVTLVTNKNVNAIDPWTIFKVHVKMAEFLGSELYVYFDLAGKQCLARIPAKYKVLTGQDIKIALDPSHSYVFDPSSELTLAFPEPEEEEKLDV
ncbi:MAG: ATP-binding cassette domain-containing protein [Eubacteriales bacterium]|nr:ATP-binding cassette domain-containing protein [Eubacteriales bacterium]